MAKDRLSLVMSRLESMCMQEPPCKFESLVDGVKETGEREVGNWRVFIVVDLGRLVLQTAV
jgi:hypothetical protein